MMIEFILSFIFLAWRMSYHKTKAEDELYDDYWENHCFLKVLHRFRLEEKFSVDVQVRVHKWLIKHLRES